MFRCTECGECCRNLHKSPLYKELHNGDGICRYLEGNKCLIYEERPFIYWVDECYTVFFKDKLNYNDYLALNYACCEILKNKKE